LNKAENLAYLGLIKAKTHLRCKLH